MTGIRTDGGSSDTGGAVLWVQEPEEMLVGERGFEPPAPASRRHGAQVNMLIHKGSTRRTVPVSCPCCCLVAAERVQANLRALSSGMAV